jgi:hypothetical protein
MWEKLVHIGGRNPKKDDHPDHTIRLTIEVESWGVVVAASLLTDAENF